MNHHHSMPTDHSKIERRRSRLTLIGTLVALVLVFLGGGVLVRKGESVEYRIRSMLAERRPHPEFVPTPAVTTTIDLTASIGLSLATEIPATLPAIPDSPPPTITLTIPSASLPTEVPHATPTPTVQLAHVGASYSISTFKHEYQTWNNCGPATVAMNLSYYGRRETQADVAAVLKPDRDDKNVGPDEMVIYAQSLGFAGLVRVNGNFDRMKHLIANDLPVIVETWFTPKPNDGMGHYRLLTGWNDAAGHFLAFDSYNGPNVKLPYDALDADWRVFNRTYVILYPPEKAAVVTAIVGEDTDDQTMHRRALAKAQSEMNKNPKEPFAWFNAGSSLVGLGRFTEAAAAFDRARTLGLPWRMLWYQFGPFEAYLAVGRFQDVIALADANLKTASDLEESYYYKGLALRALGQPDQARQSFQTALKFNKNFALAREALAATQ